MKPIKINDPHVSGDTLVGRQDICKYLKIAISYWDKLVQQGKAPRKVTPAHMFPRWKVKDIRAFNDKMLCYGAYRECAVDFKTAKNDALVDIKTCAAYFNTTRSAWSNWVAAGKAPKPINPDAPRPRWRVGDIKKWFKF